MSGNNNTFKIAYQIIEVPYVKFRGTNIYEVEQFVKSALDDSTETVYSLDIKVIRGKLECALIGPGDSTRQLINVGDFIIRIDDKIYVNRPSYFYRHFKVRRPR